MAVAVARNTLGLEINTTALEATPALAQIATIEEKLDGCGYCRQTCLAVVLLSASW
ncbi:unnamed protein product [Ectocarpus sp. 12 AP-2014]